MRTINRWNLLLMIERRSPSTIGRQVPKDRRPALRRLLVVMVALGLVYCASIANAQSFSSAVGPRTVHPGHIVRYRAKGFQPESEVNVTIQPRSCLGSNGCYAGVRRVWRTSATGSAIVQFRFPKHYGFCTAVGCTDYQRFQKGKYAQVQICDIQYAEGEGQGYVACAVKMVRIGSG